MLQTLCKVLVLRVLDEITKGSMFLARSTRTDVISKFTEDNGRRRQFLWTL